MSNVVTLDSIRTAAKRKYAPVTVGLSDGTEVELRGIIRLPKDDREKVVENFKLFGNILKEGEGVDDLSEDDREFLVETLSDTLLKLAARSGRRLVAEIDGDLTLLMEIFEQWVDASQLGEAVSSPN